MTTECKIRVRKTRSGNNLEAYCFTHKWEAYLPGDDKAMRDRILTHHAKGTENGIGENTAPQTEPCPLCGAEALVPCRHTADEWRRWEDAGEHVQHNVEQYRKRKEGR